ncbi:hypothetical protein J4475_04225, partial [Candidatus Woesearchaeota archaeon]|nr:hypothetical protein [Candidatus Woesearchaeota archaeon]
TSNMRVETVINSNFFISSSWPVEQLAGDVGNAELGYIKNDAAIYNFSINAKTVNEFKLRIRNTDNKKSLNTGCHVNLTIPSGWASVSAPNPQTGFSVVRVTGSESAGWQVGAITSSVISADGSLNISFNGTSPLRENRTGYLINTTISQCTTETGTTVNAIAEAVAVVEAGELIPPYINLTSPDNNSVDTDGIVVFQYNVTDNSSISSCTLFIDSVQDQTDTTITVNQINNFTSTLAEGIRTWYVNCTDSYGNTNISATRTINVSLPPDNEPPVVQLQYPTSGTVFSNFVNFTYNVSDNNAVSNCSLTLNGNIVSSDTSILEGVNQSFEFYLEPNNYTWSVNCTDNSISANKGNSSKSSFNNTYLVVYRELASPMDKDQIGYVGGVVYNPAGYSQDISAFVVNASTPTQVFNAISAGTGFPSDPTSSNTDIRWSGTFTVPARGARGVMPFYVREDMKGNDVTANIVLHATLSGTSIDFESSAKSTNWYSTDSPFVEIGQVVSNSYPRYNRTLEPGQATSFTMRAVEVANKKNGAILSSAGCNFSVSIPGNWTSVTATGSQPGFTSVQVSGDSDHGWNVFGTVNVQLLNSQVDLNFTATTPVVTQQTGYVFSSTLSSCSDQNGNPVSSLSESVMVVQQDNFAPEVTIINPPATISLYNFTDSTNNRAYGGADSNNPPPPPNRLQGTEAASSEYTAIQKSDDTEWRTTVTTTNDHVYQSYKFLVLEDVTDISQIVLTYEGFATKDLTLTADDLYLYVWNESGTPVYSQWATITDTADNTVSLTIAGGFADYIDANGTLWVLAESKQQTKNNQRTDIVTDFVDVKVTTRTIISGQQVINVSATDANTVSTVTFQFRNSTANTTWDALVQEGSTDYWSNATNTVLLADGQYSLFINASDNIGNFGDSTYRLVTVANLPPTVTLNRPLNRSNQTTSTMNFNWTATISSGGFLVCDMSLDGKVNFTDQIVTSGAASNHSISGLKEGNHFWNVSCAKAGGTRGNSEVWNFTVDTNAPNVTLNSPADQFWNNTERITLNFSASDSSDITNCTLRLNGLYNQSLGAGQINNGGSSIFGLAGLPEAVYNWSVRCADFLNFNTTTSNRTFYIDRTMPYVNLSEPAPGASFSETTINFNYTAYDNLDTTILCNITVDGQAKDSYTATNGTFTNRILTNIGDGTHFWNVTCSDSAGNTNYSETRNFSGVSPPVIIPTDPTNNSFDVDGNITFFYNATDGNGLAQCSLFINNVLNQTNSTALVQGGRNNFTTTNFSQGIYNWTLHRFRSPGCVIESAP